MPFNCMGKMIKGQAKPVDLIGKEVVIFYGLGFSNPVIASKINQYVFALKPWLLQRLLIKAFYKQSMPRWIKKPAEAKEDDIRKYCRENDIQYSTVVVELVQQNMGMFLHEIRATDKQFAEAGIALTRPEENKWF